MGGKGKADDPYDAGSYVVTGGLVARGELLWTYEGKMGFIGGTG